VSGERLVDFLEAPLGVERRWGRDGWTVTVADFSRCGAYRYLLGRYWRDGPVLQWWMFNPSKASDLDGDHTITKCIVFSDRAGFGGLEVVNLYALVSTDPKVVEAHPDPMGPACGLYLQKAAALMLAARQASGWAPWRAAWGGFRPARKRARRVFGAILRDACEAWGDPEGPAMDCLGLSAAGDPYHPLRLPYATEAREYRPLLNLGLRVPPLAPVAP
jgi:hypothetical protein